MKYLCIVHCEPGAFDTMTEAERRMLDRDSLAYDQELMARGVFLYAQALQSADSAAIVKVRSGQMSMTQTPSVRLVLSGPAGVALLERLTALSKELEANGTLKRIAPPQPSGVTH